MALRWESWGDECAAYFCWRMAPKLIELPEFDGLPETALYPCRSCIQQWKDAVITILSWADNGTVSVSKEFEDFYNGLLYFRNVFDSTEGILQKKLLAVVFEIHGSDPAVLPEAVDYALKLWDLIPRDIREDEKTEFQTLVWPENTSAPPGVQTLRRELYPRISSLREGPVGCPFERVKHIYGNIGNYTFLPTPLPMAQGLRICVQRAFDLCRKKLWDMILEDCQTRDVSTISDKPDETSHRESNIDICLTVGPSGCGKTRRLFQLLRSQWGFYLLPGNLPRRPSPTPRRSRAHSSVIRQKPKDEALFDELSCRARRSGGSRDTQTWHDDIKAMDRKGFHCWAIAYTRIRLLLKIRLGVLQDFLDPAYRRAYPADWLNFQTSFDGRGRDIFNDLFRIVRLSVTGPGNWKWPISDGPPPVPGIWNLSLPRSPEDSRYEKLLFPNEPGMLPRIASNLLICIDEAQCDLQDMFQGRPCLIPGSGSRSFHPFSCIMEGAAFEIFEIQESNYIQMIISGTALQLQSTLRTLGADIPRIQNVSSLMEFTKKLFEFASEGKSDSASQEEFMKKAREDHIKALDVEPKLHVESDFQLVEDDSSFTELLMEMIPGCDERLQSMIREHSKPLRGRYQWSVCYLNEIKNVIKRKGGIDPQAFGEEAAKCYQRVYVVAKEGLKSRLKEIDGRSFQELSDMFQNRSAQSNPYASKVLLEDVLKRQDQRKKMLDELCWLAVRSDLLGESTIFQSEECAEMVTLGFAFAEKAGHGGTKIARKIVLKERIAVEAAVEYFQAQTLDGKSSRYDDALKRSFYQEQGNLSALGKKAELFFAWHLKKVLRTPGRRMDAVLPTFSRRERMKVLNLLVGQAKSVEELLHGSEHRSNADTRSKVQFGCDPDQLYLIEGAQTAFQEKNYGGRLETMWGWLKMVREGSPGLKSTFWFPSDKAGPDVIFALKGTKRHLDRSLQIIEPGVLGPKDTTGESGDEPEKIDNHIVLCIVQIKRQEANRDIPGAILSTSPNHWFRQGSNSEAKHILQELSEWRKERHPIVRILITSLTDPPTDNPKKKQPKEYLQEEMTESPTWEKFSPNTRKTKGKSRKVKGKSRKTTGKSSKLSANDDSKDFEGVGIPLNQQYFNWIGAEHDGDLFGAAFKEFNRVERNA